MADVVPDARRVVRAVETDPAVAEHKLAFPHLRDADGSRLKAFQVVGYPETVVLDRQGRIAATSRGVVDDSFFTQKVEPLLRERA